MSLADPELARDRDALMQAIDANRKRRAKADLEADRAREELAELLVEGRALGLKVAPMARLAGVSRPTAYALLDSAQVDD